MTSNQLLIQLDWPLLYSTGFCWPVRGVSSSSVETSTYSSEHYSGNTRWIRSANPNRNCPVRRHSKWTWDNLHLIILFLTDLNGNTIMTITDHIRYGIRFLSGRIASFLIHPIKVFEIGFERIFDHFDHRFRLTWNEKLILFPLNWRGDNPRRNKCFCNLKKPPEN